jgi:hypothetical protein
MDLMNFLKTRPLIGGALVLMASGTLFAGETLTLSSGSATGTGSSATCGGLAQPGEICFAGTVGDWQVIEVVGAGYPAAGTLLTPDQDVSTLATSTVPNAAALNVNFTETGFGPATSGTFSYLEGAILNTAGMTDTFSFNAGGTTGGVNTASSPLGLFMGSVFVSSMPSTYSIELSEVITATLTDSEASTDSNLTGATAPEPGLYALTGIGLFALMALAARKRNKRVAEQ